jgi:hypothetical protein
MITLLKMFTKNINESKVFAGLIIILLNVGGRLVPVNLSKSAERIAKSKLSRDIIVFAISWMGTRDVLVAVCLTLFFIVLSDYLLNYENNWCIIPEKYRTHIEDTEEENITEEEINKAIALLEKYKKQQQAQDQHYVYMRYFRN